MNRKVLTGVAISLLVAASLIAVGAIAFRAGQRHDGEGRIVRELVTGDEGAGTVIVTDGWRHGWHGPGFGFLVFPLVVVGLILLFSSRRGRWGGPWRSREDDLREWHRRAHAEEATTAGPPQAPVPPAVTPPDPPARA